MSHWKGVFREKGGRCSGARWDGGDAGDAGADDSAPAVAAICAASPVMHACVRGRASTSAAFRVVVWPWAVARAGEELRAAVEEWQVKRGTAAAAGAQRLTTAFLDGIYPIVDVYELKVGLRTHPEPALPALRCWQSAPCPSRLALAGGAALAAGLGSRALPRPAPPRCPALGAAGAHAAAAAGAAAGHADGAAVPPHAAAVPVRRCGGQQPAPAAPPGHHTRFKRHRGAAGGWGWRAYGCCAGRAGAGFATCCSVRVKRLPSPAALSLAHPTCGGWAACAPQDLLLPDEGQGFVTMRCPLRDVEEEDISPHLPGGLPGRRAAPVGRRRSRRAAKGRVAEPGCAGPRHGTAVRWRSWGCGPGW